MFYGLSHFFLTNRTETATIANARAAVIPAAMLPMVMSIFQWAYTVASVLNTVFSVIFSPLLGSVYHPSKMYPSRSDDTIDILLEKVSVARRL